MTKLLLQTFGKPIKVTNKPRNKFANILFEPLKKRMIKSLFEILVLVSLTLELVLIVQSFGNRRAWFMSNEW